MTRRAIGGMVAMLLGAALGGCSREPPPLQPAREIHAEPTSTASVELPPAKPPAKSDAAAVAIVTAALDAHTSNQPTLLQKLKSVRLSREGRIVTGQQPIKQKWQVQAVWPDRFRVTAELQGREVTLARLGDTAWKHAAGTGKMPMPPAELKEFQMETTGEWLQLLFPLTDPGTILAPAPDTEVNKKLAVGVRVWNPVLADAILHFDKETKLLAQITYDGRESGRKVTKQIVVIESRPFTGVKLPSQTVVKSNGIELAEWTMTSLEPQSSIDAKVFEQP